MKEHHAPRDLQGILFIGDPHIQARRPDFRKDDFAKTVLGKIEWCLEYAKENRLLPALLGDLFENARNNPNWILIHAMKLLQGSGAIGIYGNHDCRETALNEHDSLSVLIAADCLQMVSLERPWTGWMNGRCVCVGGSSYREEIPYEVDSKRYENSFGPPRSLFDADPLVIWMSHHDIALVGYESGKFEPFEIRNVDLLINGHIHRALESVIAGQTTWMNPGNISRRKRSDASRQHSPHATRVDINQDDGNTDCETPGFTAFCIEIPHRPFDEVFHACVEVDETEPGGRTFAAGLKELELRRTDSGAGLHDFIEQNIKQYDPAVADELRTLALAVTAEKGMEQA